MSVVVFSCGNEKCFATVDPATLNDLRLKIIRSGAVLCKSCGERTIWLETSMLIDVEKITKIPNEMEGKKRAKQNLKSGSNAH
jgi:hypothetical protein